METKTSASAYFMQAGIGKAMDYLRRRPGRTAAAHRACALGACIQAGEWSLPRPSVVTPKPANGGQGKTGQRKWRSRTEIVLPCRLLWWQVGFGSPAPRAALEHVAVVQQAVEHGAHGGRVAQQFAPVFHRTVGGQHGAGAL